MYLIDINFNCTSSMYSRLVIIMKLKSFRKYLNFTNNLHKNQFNFIEEHKSLFACFCLVTVRND